MIEIYGNTGAQSEYLGPLAPSACTVAETLNGELALTLTHPYDTEGRWKRIEKERIIVAPMPDEPLPGFAWEHGTLHVYRAASAVTLYVRVDGSFDDFSALYSEIGTLAVGGYFIGDGAAISLTSSPFDNDTYYKGRATGQTVVCYISAFEWSSMVLLGDLGRIPEERYVPVTRMQTESFRVNSVQRTFDGVTVNARAIFYDGERDVLHAANLTE